MADGFASHRYRACPSTGLPPRTVQTKAGGMTEFTVTQGASHRKLFAKLPALARMRNNTVTSGVLRGGFVKRGAVQQHACAPSTCTIDAGGGGEGYTTAAVVCNGAGTGFAATVTVNAGRVQTVMPHTDLGVVTGWAIGSTFTVHQVGCTAVATGSVATLREVQRPRRARNVYDVGDEYSVEDIPKLWRDAKQRVDTDIVRKRDLTCRCRPGCPVKATEVYDWGGILQNTVRVTIHQATGHDADPPCSPDPMSPEIKREIRDLRSQNLTPIQILKHLTRGSTDAPGSGNGLSLERVRCIVKGQKPSVRGAGGELLCEAEKLEYWPRNIIHPHVSEANGDLIYCDMPDRTVPRDHEDGSFTAVYIGSRQFAGRNMQSRNIIFAADAQDTLVKGCSLYIFGHMCRATPNPRRPGCPLGETFMPLGYALTDRQDSDFLESVVSAVERWRSCHTDGCDHPTKVSASIRGGWSMSRACTHGPPPPIRRFRSDLYGAEEQARKRVQGAVALCSIEDTGVGSGAARDGGVFPRQLPGALHRMCDFHDIMAQFQPVPQRSKPRQT
jgi:hypothetical protein